MGDFPRDARDPRWQPTRIVGDPVITLNFPLEDEDGKILLRAGTTLRVSSIYVTESGLGVDVYDPHGGKDGYHIDEYYPYGSVWDETKRWFIWGGKLDDGKETHVYPPLIAANVVSDLQRQGEDVWSMSVLDEMRRRMKGAI